MDRCQHPFITFSLYFYLFLCSCETPPTPRARLEELRMFLENETWELCPVKSNFNISQLHVSAQPYRQRLGSVGLFSAVTFACLACDISIWIWNAGDHWFLCLCKNVSPHIDMKEGKEKFTAPCIIQKKRWKSACSYVGVDVWGFLYPPNQLKLKISARRGSSQNPKWGASLMYVCHNQLEEKFILLAKSWVYVRKRDVRKISWRKFLFRLSYVLFLSLCLGPFQANTRAKESS